MKLHTLPSVVGVLVACGGSIQSSGDGGDAGGMTDSPLDGLSDGGGWTKCAAPDGVSICGGPNGCGPQCQKCADLPDAGIDIGVCEDNGAYIVDYPDRAADTYLCPDGAFNACDNDSNAPGCWENTCSTQDLPQLYLMNGRPDLAKYADRSTYTGNPLPTPTTCPTISGLTLCGGVCGASTCSDSAHVCTGRSPLHPYSLCLPAEPQSFPCARGSNGSCNSVHPGFMCLTYQVDSAAQPIADQGSICVDGNICQAAAASYPGGAFCTTGS